MKFLKDGEIVYTVSTFIQFYIKPEDFKDKYKKNDYIKRDDLGSF